MNNLIKKVHYYCILTGMLAVPQFTQAQAPASDIRSLITFIAKLFQEWLIPMMVTLALIYTIWAAVVYIQTDDNAAAKAEKKEQIFWGIIGLFVIVSIWSLVSVVQNTFGIFSGGTLK